MNETSATLRRRWFQVSLREWFLLVALLVVGLGLWREHAKTIRLRTDIKHHKQVQAKSNMELFTTLGELHEAQAQINKLTAPDPKARSDAIFKAVDEKVKRFRAQRTDGFENDAIIQEVR